jgi:pyruvate,water dikinase
MTRFSGPPSSRFIEATQRQGRKMGLCEKAPTDHAAFAGFLVEAGIDLMSVGPDTFLRVKRHVATAEAGHGRVQAD